MPANWITERPSLRRMPLPLEQPRLELPVSQPSFERAPAADPAEPEQAKRGSVVVDFYI